MSVAIFDDEGDYGAVIVSGANLAIMPEQASDDLLRQGKVLVLQNEIPELVNEAVARRARAQGLTIIINAAPARAFATSLSDLIDVLVVNAIEAEMLGGGRVASLESAAEAAATLASRFRSAIVTAGADGVAFCGENGQRVILPGLPVKVASTHGAGDTFVGTLAAWLALGDTMSAALTVANQEAAKLVSTPESARTF